MKIKAQTAMVLNLDKCLGCHACTVACKNVWTSAKGAEYMWFNNVETKPGLGYPRDWANQEKFRAGWRRKDGRAVLRSGGKPEKYLNIFATPRMPELEDYAEPWTYDYARLTNSPPVRQQPVARPISAVTGRPFEPRWGSNWEDDLGGVSELGERDQNFAGLDGRAFLDFERVFMLHLPRLCEHCLHPACVASCPSGAMYKRDEDGIVLADQTRCRGWRHCVSNCPYKKVYFNWRLHRAQKCLLCYPRLENGQPTLCAHSCVGRIRYLGVLLYDADRVEAAAGADEAGLYAAQLDLLLDPRDPEVAARAEADGVPAETLDAARRSPVRKLICEWRLALPLHPEFRTLPMVWYIPPASPLVLDVPPAGSEAATDGGPENMRIPLRYLANLFTAGDEAPVRAALAKLAALRAHMREAQFGGPEPEILHRAANLPDSGGRLARAGMTPSQAVEMYELLAIARYGQRFVLPTAGREKTEDAYALRGESGFPRREESL